MSWQSGLYQTPVLAILLMGWVLTFLLMLLVRKNSLGEVEFEWGVFLFFLCCYDSCNCLPDFGNEHFVMLRVRERYFPWVCSPF